ncbi:OmpP1/FadL family transporter [Flavimaricola marinus]|uniref:Outer membrane protein transport protein (OMPP1/FadL/TodX) n=1 Tax=Flavimaricola marinus TaxID=1819565 RepID=A0A238LCK6_9RHOB|nr:outer membrane protein transport protein [Flavimaricola marinus]SMY07358.1 Outer membrane protein transport protein (OMPP1/FadL/TodX) [Flavimaricola marinus]
MKTIWTTGAALLLTTTTAGAVGLDRSNQDVSAIFEDGNYAELSFGYVMPTATGTDLGSGFDYDNVAEEFFQFGASLKMDYGPNTSFALIVDQPFGADILYPDNPATPLLEGTAAQLNSVAFTAVGRYKFNDNFSVHGGVRAETLDAEISLGGLAYGGLDGYNVELESSTAFGYLAGVAYERPDIALRLAVTYNSAITHEFNSIESVNGVIVNPGSITEVQTPEAVNIDFQTGIMADTLLFGQVRYAMYSETLVSPDFFAANTGGGSLTDIDDAASYSIGIGRRFTDEFSASFSVGYEESTDPLVSPLSPSDGQTSLALGGQYTFDNIVLSGGVRYTMLGDAMPETSGAARADFTDNSALSIGMSIGYRF